MTATAHDLMSSLLAEARTVPAQAWVPRAAAVRTAGGPASGGGGGVGLAACDGGGAASLDQVQRRRTAVRFYDGSPLAREAAAGLLAAARALDAACWPGQHRAAPLRCYLAVRAVSGLAPGLYAQGTSARDRVCGLPPGEALEEMVLQREYAEAPVLLLVTGSLRQALDTAGSHGHRELLIRAGAACHAAWLDAVGRGLVGSIFAGFLPSALRALAGVDGYRQTQLLALAVGSPRQPVG